MLAYCVERNNTFVGCFEYEGTDAKNVEENKTEDFTIESCYTLAVAQQKPTFGIAAGGSKCIPLDSDSRGPPNLQRVGKDKCETNGKSPVEQPLGSVQHLAVYITNPAFVGCFANIGAQKIDGDPNAVTMSTCNDLAFEQGKKTFGVGHSKSNKLGDVACVPLDSGLDGPNLDRLPDEKCVTKRNPVETQLQGGYNSIAIYKVFDTRLRCPALRVAKKMLKENEKFSNEIADEAGCKKNEESNDGDHGEVSLRSICAMTEVQSRLTVDTSVAMTTSVDAQKANDLAVVYECSKNSISCATWAMASSVMSYSVVKEITAGCKDEVYGFSPPSIQFESHKIWHVPTKETPGYVILTTHYVKQRRHRTNVQKLVSLNNQYAFPIHGMKKKKSAGKICVKNRVLSSLFTSRQQFFCQSSLCFKIYL